MAEPAATQRGRISALLKKMPAEAAFRLVEAVGLFAPLACLIDRSAVSDDNGAETGRIASRSLQPIWRWLSEDAAPEQAGQVVETFARAAIGSSAPGANLLSSLPALRAEMGREALRALDQRPPGDLAAALGSQRAAHDAHVLARGLVISEQLEKLRALAIGEKNELPPAAVEIAREVAQLEPECASAFACAVAAQLRRTADIAPVLLALAKRREEHRLDKSSLAPAAYAAIEAACARGASGLSPGAAPDAALAAARERARDVADLSAALRGRVSDDWARRLTQRLGEAGRMLEQLCGEYCALLRNALSCPDLGLEPEAARAVADAASFLKETEAVATTLRFEAARRRTVNELLRELEGAPADSAEERLKGLAQRSTAQAASYVELRADVIELFQGRFAARAWLRRGRRIIGRPTFAEFVLAGIEPALVDDDGMPLRDGQVARELVDALWDWTGSHALKSAREEASLGFDRERDRDPRAAFDHVVKHRRALAQATRDAMSPTSGFSPTARGAIRTQLAVIAALLSAETEIRNRLETWPQRVKHVMEEHVASARELHDAVTASWPEIEPTLLVVIMGRLDRPWQVLRILERIARTTSDTLIEATEFVAIGEILIDRAEADARFFRVFSGEHIDADRIIAALERFAGIASGMTEEFQIRKSGKWGSRLYALKARAARDLEALCASAVDAIDAVTPRISHAGGKWSADVSGMLDEGRVAAAAQFARFLRNSKVLDHRAAFAGARTKAIARIDGRLTSQVEALLALAHAGEVRDQALAHLRSIAGIVGEFEGQEAGDILLRRAAAA